MQVRQILVASLLAITAVGAMSQEIDRSETLQAKSLAAQAEKAANAEAPVAKATPDTKIAQTKPHAHGRLDLTRWHPARKAVVEAQG